MSDPVDRSLLEAGERVLWWSRPSPSRYAWYWLGVLILIFTLSCGILTAFLFADVMRNKAINTPSILLFTGVVLGSFFFSYLFLSELRKASHLVYAITNRRALVFEKSGAQLLHDRALSAIEAVFVRKSTKDGIGNLIFFKRDTGESVVDDGFIATPQVQVADALLTRLVNDENLRKPM